MVMSFFRRTDEQMRSGNSGIPRAPQSRSDFNESQAFGSVVEESHLSSEDLISGLGYLQDRVSSLLGAHGEALNELTALRAERARIASLLEYESGVRRKLDSESLRIAAENKELKADNYHLRLESDEAREKLIKLQALFDANAQDLQVIQARLRDVGRELDERIDQYDETAALLKRAHQDLDQRNREYAAMRERYENEKTAHQVFTETSRREAEAQSREITRLNEEKKQLKNSLSHHETQARTLASEVMGLKQELSFAEEKLKRLQSELDNQQTATSIEMSQLQTKNDAINSKVELVEKLLVTARGRSKLAEDELQAVRAELKQTKAEFSTVALRADRLSQELVAARSGSSDSEAQRRELAMQVNELTMRLRDSENLRVKRERDNEAMKHDFDQRGFADQEEIRQLRTSAEVAKAEMLQLRTEIAILTGQLEFQRNDRLDRPDRATTATTDYGAAAPSATSSISASTAPRPATADGMPKPIIDISEKSLRNPRPSVDY